MHPTLKRELAANRLHHSYLLIGDDESCIEQIQELLALLKITAADTKTFFDGLTITISQIRQLIRSLELAPHSSRYKVVGLPGHRLGLEAAQALLKTLEEPPAHTLFLLHTPHERLVPATIVSRCERLYLGKFGAKHDAISFDTVRAMTVPERFELAQQLVESQDCAKTLDQWMMELHNDGHNAQALKLIEEMLTLKQRLTTNTNVTLQLEAFFYNL